MIDQLAAVGHHPKVVVYQSLARTGLGYRVKLVCTRCRQTLEGLAL